MGQLRAVSLHGRPLRSRYYPAWEGAFLCLIFSALSGEELSLPETCTVQLRSLCARPHDPLSTLRI